MKIDAHFTSGEVDQGDLADRLVVVIDVVRATTTIVEALANGARGIYPTDSTEEAVKLAHSLGRDDALLCGERRGQKVEGFDLGNSPADFTPDAVGGKRLVMSTTNGTTAFSLAHESERVLACAFTNLSAVAEEVSGVEELVVLCAGREGRFSMADALCAGHLIARLVQESEDDHELNDAAMAAKTLASRKPSKRLLLGTAGGKALVEIGLEDDLEICVEIDRHDFVAEMVDQAVIRSGA
ncbi:MAG: 2-phosphosulfolactate phosphatase [Gemmatimonadota bacterium]|jgi:2-phosphosulfolactate phosphatase